MGSHLADLHSKTSQMNALKETLDELSGQLQAIDQDGKAAAAILEMCQNEEKKMNQLKREMDGMDAEVAEERSNMLKALHNIFMEYNGDDVEKKPLRQRGTATTMNSLADPEPVEEEKVDPDDQMILEEASEKRKVRLNKLPSTVNILRAPSEINMDDVMQARNSLPSSEL